MPRRAAPAGAHTARELRARTRAGQSREESNLMVLGDFNIDKRQGNPLFDAFVQTGLWVPEPLQTARTTTGKEARHYDQIAWFQGEDFGLRPTGRAGVIDFAGAVFLASARPGSPPTSATTCRCGSSSISTVVRKRWPACLGPTLMGRSRLVGFWGRGRVGALMSPVALPTGPAMQA